METQIEKLTVVLLCMLVCMLPAVMCNDAAAACTHVKYLNMSTTHLQLLQGDWWGQYVLKETRSRGVEDASYRSNCRLQRYNSSYDTPRSAELQSFYIPASEDGWKAPYQGVLVRVEVVNDLLSIEGSSNLYGLLVVDPENYMITYTCSKDEEHSEIWTRNKSSVDSEMLEGIEYTLKRSKLTLAEYETTPATLCPDKNTSS